MNIGTLVDSYFTNSSVRSRRIAERDFFAIVALCLQWREANQMDREHVKGFAEKAKGAIMPVDEALQESRHLLTLLAA